MRGGYDIGRQHVQQRLAMNGGRSVDFKDAIQTEAC